MCVCVVPEPLHTIRSVIMNNYVLLPLHAGAHTVFGTFFVHSNYLFLLSAQEGMDLDVECGKKLIELDALISKDGNGITEQMNFTSKASFDKFWNWFSPT